MKIEIERTTLLRALSHAQSVVERRNTIPILSNVLLKATDGRLEIMATDLDLQIEETVPAEVSVSGSTTVQAQTFFDIVRKLPEDGRVSLSAADGRLAVSAGRARFSLATLPTEDMPVIATGDLPFSFAIPVDTLRLMIERTRFAISTEETRYYLNGVYLHTASGESAADPAVLRAAATDGHRLARFTMEIPDGAESIPGVIIPRKCIAELRRLIDDAQEKIAISLSDRKIRFELGSAILTSKLIDGTFPDYTRVIPTSNDKLLSINPRDMSSGIDRVSTIGSDKTRAVSIAVDRDRVRLSMSSPENGTASEEVAADYGSSDITIGFNSRYLMDVLAQIPGDRVEIHMNDSSAPTLLTAGPDSDAVYVLMPMRL